MSEGKVNCVCILDCCQDVEQYRATQLITELTGRSVGECSNEDSAEWTIDNKYYRTEVHLKVIVPGSVASQRDKDHTATDCEAVIIICDPSQPLSIKSAYLTWEEFTAEATPTVNLLVGVVDGCGLVEDVKCEMLKWCSGRGVELVMWNMSTKSQSQSIDEEDDFPESVGVVRISEALQAHMWPRMRLKNSSNRHHVEEEEGGSHEQEASSSVCVNDDNAEKTERDREHHRLFNGSEVYPSATVSSSSQLTEGHTTAVTLSTTTVLPADSSCSGLTTANISTDPHQSRLDSLLPTTTGMDVLCSSGSEREGQVDGDSDEFENLFAKFADMKAHAQSLPHEERKAYAEKVVMSFWNAIGGDEGEINSDSDSNSTERDNNY